MKLRHLKALLAVLLLMGLGACGSTAHPTGEAQPASAAQPGCVQSLDLYAAGAITDSELGTSSGPLLAPLKGTPADVASDVTAWLASPTSCQA
jgi:hypothetical protein